AVHSPGGEDPLGEAILARPADVVHDLALAALDDRLADARREVVEHFVPGYLLPLPLTAAPDTAQWKEDAVGVCHLVQSRGALGAVASPRARMLGVAFELLHFQGRAVDVGEQAARGLAVEAGRGDQQVA